jgi:hypothetical protein
VEVGRMIHDDRMAVKPRSERRRTDWTILDHHV